ncbi:hypothetical protein [Nocardia sp. NPDC004722]
MSEPRGGWEPIALPQDQVEIEGPQGYWSGSGKAVWAAVPAVLIGGFLLLFGVTTLAEHRIAAMPVYGYALFAMMLLVTAALCLGGILLLFRLIVGKYAIIAACGLLIVWGVVGAIIEGEVGSPGHAVSVAVVFGAIIALTASKSTKRWLRAGRG